jgi:hypothetical protein
MDPTLLADGAVVIQPYNKSQSPFQVLTNASLFCAEAMMRCAKFANGTRPMPPCKKDPANPAWNPVEFFCPPGESVGSAAVQEYKEAVKAGMAFTEAQSARMHLGGHGPPNPFDAGWTSIPVEAGDDKATVKVDVSGVNGTVVGIRYGVPLVPSNPPLTPSNPPSNPPNKQCKNSRCQQRFRWDPVRFGLLLDAGVHAKGRQGKEKVGAVGYRASDTRVAVRVCPSSHSRGAESAIWPF